MTKEKNLGGRPAIILTPDQIAQVEALSSMLSVEQIADFLGISKTTFYKIIERQPEVYARYKKGRAKGIGQTAKSLLLQAQNGNIPAAIFYLKTQAGWKETSGIELTTKVTDDGSNEW